jgi:hypothetical protein
MSAMAWIRDRLGFLPAHLHRLLPVWVILGALCWLAPAAIVEWLGVLAQPWFWWLLLPAVLLLAARLAPAHAGPAALRLRHAPALRKRRSHLAAAPVRAA